MQYNEKSVLNDILNGNIPKSSENKKFLNNHELPDMGYRVPDFSKDL